MVRLLTPNSKARLARVSCPRWHNTSSIAFRRSRAVTPIHPPLPLLAVLNVIKSQATLRLIKNNFNFIKKAPIIRFLLLKSNYRSFIFCITLLLLYTIHKHFLSYISFSCHYIIKAAAPNAPASFPREAQTILTGA